MANAHILEKPTTIAVMFGGRSSEHEISLRSAVFILKNLPKNSRIIPIGIDREGRMWTPEGDFTSDELEAVEEKHLARLIDQQAQPEFGSRRILSAQILPIRRSVVLSGFQQGSPFSFRLLNSEIDIVFPVLHGPNGEDGRWQGVFELAEIPYVGCDLRASAIGMDKDIQKRLVKIEGVPVVRYESISEDEWSDRPEVVTERIEQSFIYPVFIKPNALGSAIGIHKAENRQALVKAISDAFRFDTKVLVEESMSGCSEVECAFLGNGYSPDISTPGEIQPKDFYSYEAKYINDDGAAIFVPARLTDQKVREVQNFAKKVAKALDLRGLSRIDFWFDKKEGGFIFNEVNTLPGMTAISLFPRLWQWDGVSPEKWISKLLLEATQVSQSREAKCVLVT